ncbi:MAG: hypothetical protein GC164_14715 [Phycisphaera sp.]|nr:hypothetical protein [Phycisphaera sp.]
MQGRPRLILASRSARRAQLLRDAGIPFVQIDPPYEDPPQPSGSDGRSLAVELAIAKARSVLSNIGLGVRKVDVVLGADTLCLGHDGSLIGQAADRDHAQKILLGFINQTHTVVSGVTLWRAGDTQPTHAFADDAGVRWGNISPEQIKKYLDSDLWMGKAGAYNLYERQADSWPITVEGDPTTVVGLPMQKIIPLLKELAFI